MMITPHRLPLGILSLLCALLLGACGQSTSLRYRVAVEVDTPEGLRTGSSVVEVRAIRSPFWAPGKRTNFEIEGEAVAVRLPGDQILFALTGKPSNLDFAKRLPFEAFEPVMDAQLEVYPLATNLDRRVEFLKTARLRTVLSDDNMPHLVRFKNPSDATTLEVVDPNNLPATFGPGHSLRQITIELTEDKVTEGVEVLIPGMQGNSGFAQWYKSLPFADPRQVSRSDFKRER